MKPARILLLVVAIVAGGLAAYLATRGQAPAPTKVQTVTEVKQEAKSQVLVAKTDIGVGDRLSEQKVEWQDWPEGAVRPEYITAGNFPDAPSLMKGTVARFEIFEGEPIRRAKLVRSDQGYLSAVIDEGMRAVSIGVSAESGAGGFIVPNDRVDVVQTQRNGTNSVSRTILSDVKVMAIGKRLGEVAGDGQDQGGDSQGQGFTNSTIATLELDPGQAETIISAASGGQLTLVLRSIVDFNKNDGGLGGQSSQAIRLIRFGTETSVMSGTVNPEVAMQDQSSSSTPQTDPLVVPSPDAPPPAPASPEVVVQ